MGGDRCVTPTLRERSRWRTVLVSYRRVSTQARKKAPPKAAPAALKGGDAVENAAIVTAVLGGTRGAARDVVLLNAGAALFVAGRADSVAAGITRAADAIDSGAARATLERMAASSHSPVDTAHGEPFDSAQGKDVVA